ncbi:MAG: alpha/beta hydrolase-fold protein [Polyangiaceae bacterium]
MNALGRRRSFRFAALLAVLIAAACNKTEPKHERQASVAPPPTVTAPPDARAPDPLVKSVWEEDGTRVEEWELAPQEKPTTRLAVLLPKEANKASAVKYPVVIALHGRGEALKRPPEGALGWAKDYDLLRAIGRMSKPPLAPADFHGFVEPARLQKMNEDLAARPYAGMIVVCPYLPDLDLRAGQEAGMQLYGDYLVQHVLPLVRSRLPAMSDAKGTGIDGVSLGGAVALYVGLGFPETFGSVGGLQPAIQSADADLWAKRVQEARARNEHQSLRLLTSAKDYFREGIGRLSSTLRARKVAHEYLDVPGPHDYIFNKGPGSYELLYFHERGMRQAAKPAP